MSLAIPTRWGKGGVSEQYEGCFISQTHVETTLDAAFHSSFEALPGADDIPGGLVLFADAPPCFNPPGSGTGLPIAECLAGTLGVSLWGDAQSVEHAPQIYPFSIGWAVLGMVGGREEATEHLRCPYRHITDHLISDRHRRTTDFVTFPPLAFHEEKDISDPGEVGDCPGGWWEST